MYDLSLTHLRLVSAYLNHLVHASGAQASPDGISQSSGGANVGAPDLGRLGVLGGHETLLVAGGGLGGTGCSWSGTHLKLAQVLYDAMFIVVK